MKAIRLQLAWLKGTLRGISQQQKTVNYRIPKKSKEKQPTIVPKKCLHLYLKSSKLQQEELRTLYIHIFPIKPSITFIIFSILRSFAQSF